MLVSAAPFTGTVSSNGDTVLRCEAYAELGEPVKTQNMSFTDGLEMGITDSEDPLYSEPFEMEGVKARKVYVKNYVYFTLDRDFYEPGDRSFVIQVDYWDFGPDPGWFHVEYNSADGKADTRVSIQKTGKEQKWCTARIFINDAEFARKLPENADIRLVSNAYNAFSKITVYNVDAAKRNGEQIDVGTVAGDRAAVMNKIGLYKGIGTDDAFDAGLNNKLARYEMIELVLDACGVGEKARTEQNKCSFSDVTMEQTAVIGYAEKLGIISGDDGGNFYPDRQATVQELLSVMMRILGYSGENLWRQAYDKAYEIGLLSNEDLILSANSELTRDNFAACAYNLLGIKNINSGVTVMEKMVIDGLIDTESLKGTEFEGVMYSAPMKAPKRKIYDAAAQREYYYMNINGARAIRPYVTQQHWCSDSKKFIISNDVHGALYEYDVDAEEIKRLDDTTASTGSAEAVVTPNDMIFYKRNQNEYWLMDWKTGKTKKVADVPNGVSTSVASITHDAKWATCYWNQKREPEDMLNGVQRIRIIPRLNLETGEWDTSLHHEFDSQPDFPHVGHPQINPTNPDLMMFCHEGTTTLIHDRIWIGDMITKEQRVLFLQAKVSETLTGETTGHEVWSYDGSEVFFIKYYYPNQNLGQQGIVRVDLEGNREYINDDYRYWHCYPSADSSWVAADTQNGTFSEIVLVNTNTYESHLLARFDTLPNPAHPYQPHPVISYDGKYVSWQMIDENGILGVGWADISEFTSNAKAQERTELSDGVTMVSHHDAVSKTEAVNKNGEDCYMTEPGNGVYIDLDKKLSPEEAGEVTLLITYLDNGRQPMSIYYTSSIHSEYERAKREDKTVQIQREGTGEWKTKEITLTDINLSDAGKFKTDFYITGSIYSNAYIKDIKVVK